MKSGIRIPVWIDHAMHESGVPFVHDIELTFDREIEPGGESVARMLPLAPDLWPDLQIGSRHDLFEPPLHGSWIEIIEPVTSN
jgi:hypothetical protein